MRIWDVEPGELCRGHLLGKHRELHGLWSAGKPCGCFQDQVAP